nr:reverse transcriptase domain-containing protein [Tanacetum cinerariifolium]
MRTCSSSNLPVVSSNPSTLNPKRRNCRRSKQPFILEESPIDTMADQRTMAELLRAPTKGYAEAIVVPPILAEQFKLKHSLINMMTSNQLFGLEKDNPYDHIRWFKKITSTIKYKDVPNSAIKLMLFLFSLARAARRWLEKEPPHSIHTWEDLVSKFINEFFPLPRTTNLRNEISNFQQRFDESFHEAWDRYKDLLHACPHHGFTELHQLDTFYNALNPADQDSLNAAAGGNLLQRRTQDVLTIIKNKSKVCNFRNKSVVSLVKSCDANSNSSSEIAKLTHAVNQQTSVVTTIMTAILKQFQATSPPASVKAVEEICVTCGGAHPYYQCLAASGNTFPELQDNIKGYVSVAAVNYNQGNSVYRPPGMGNQIRPLGFAQPNVQNNQNRFGQPQGFNRGNNFNPEQSYQAQTQQNQIVPLNELEKVKRMNEANMKAMQTEINMVKNELRNEIKNSIQTSLSNQTNEIKNMMASLFQMNTASTSGSGSLYSNTVANPKGKLKAITTRSGLVVVGPIVPTPRPFINPEEDERVEETLTDPDLSEYTIKSPLILGRPFLRTVRALIDVHGEEMILRDGDERLSLNMRHDTSSYSNQPQKESINLINVFNNSSEYFLEDLFTNQPSGNPTFSSHPELTLPEVKDDIFDLEGGNVLPEKLLDLDSTKDLYPPLHVNQLSGSTTYSSSPNPLLEELADELALITFPLKYDDDLYNVANPADNFVDSMPEMFTDEHALDYSSPPIFDEYNDDFLEVESDTENVYDDPFDSKGEKIKESKLLIDKLDLPCDFLLPFEYDSFVSQDFLGLMLCPQPTTRTMYLTQDFDPPFYELSFFKEVPRSSMLLPFSSKNEEKVFKPGIHTSKKVHSSRIPELSHQGYKVFKINQIFKSPMKIFLFSCGKTPTS